MNHEATEQPLPSSDASRTTAPVSSLVPTSVSPARAPGRGLLVPILALLAVLVGMEAYQTAILVLNRPADGEAAVSVETVPRIVGWDYRIESIPDDAWSEEMRELGLAGWEVSSCRRATSRDGDDEVVPLYECIFKRPF